MVGREIDLIELTSSVLPSASRRFSGPSLHSIVSLIASPAFSVVRTDSFYFIQPSSLSLPRLQTPLHPPRPRPPLPPRILRLGQSRRPTARSLGSQLEGDCLGHLLGRFYRRGETISVISSSFARWLTLRRVFLDTTTCFRSSRLPSSSLSPPPPPHRLLPRPPTFTLPQCPRLPNPRALPPPTLPLPRLFLLAVPPSPLPVDFPPPTLSLHLFPPQTTLQTLLPLPTSRPRHLHRSGLESERRYLEARNPIRSWNGTSWRRRNRRSPFRCEVVVGDCAGGSSGGVADGGLLEVLCRGRRRRRRGRKGGEGEERVDGSLGGRMGKGGVEEGKAGKSQISEEVPRSTLRLQAPNSSSFDGQRKLQLERRVVLGNPTSSRPRSFLISFISFNLPAHHPTPLTSQSRHLHLRYTPKHPSLQHPFVRRRFKKSENGTRTLVG